MSSGSIVQFRPTVGFAHESITVDNTAGGVGLTSATYAPTGAKVASEAFVTVEDGPMRYTYDGTAPTSSIGHKASNGAILVLKGEHQMANFKAIRTGSTSATLRVTYERE